MSEAQASERTGDDNGDQGGRADGGGECELGARLEGGFEGDVQG